MSAKKTGLGRGFESLIPTELLDESFDPTASEDGQVSDLRLIKLSEIIADPNQPRRSFDEDSLEELAASIKEHGVLQPIVVTPHQGSYMVVAGERRFRAAGMAQLEKIPALVRTLNNQHKLEVSLIENLQRRDLNPLEAATAYLKLRDQFNLTLDEIGDRVGGKSMSAVSNTLRLLRLPALVRDAIAKGEVSEGQARPLIGLDEKNIASLLPRIIKEGWSSRMIEQYVSQLKKQPREAKKQITTNAAILRKYRNGATQFEKRFASPVKVKTTGEESGQIIISFKSSKEFDRIAKLIDR